MINILPDTILYEIVLWLPNEDQLSFASINVIFSQFLLKRIRKIDLKNEKSKLYFTLHSFREKIHSLIINPLDQLGLEIFDNQSDILDIPDISCFTLETLGDELIESLLMNRIKKVKNLRLHYNECSPQLFELISRWINNISLHDLTIFGDDFTDFPLVPSLESLYVCNCPSLQINGLHIPAYSNLRMLGISNCPSIEDVRCLDRIHELHLISCEGICDISCLNNNYKILIEDCENIIDYSNCFRYSKVVEIICSSYNEVNFDFSKLFQVREFSISADDETSITNFVFPPSLTLKRICLEMNYLFTIPAENKFQYTVISSCPKFSSLLHFGCIHTIYFENLQITTLEGLGSGNRVVQICNCHLLTDFSLLRHSDKVSIIRCKGFHDINQLRGVQDFTFSPTEDNNLPDDLEGITCMFLRDIPDESYSIKYPKSLKRLEIEQGSIDQFPSFLTALPTHIHMVKVGRSPATFDFYERWWASMDKESFLADFIIEFKRKDVYFIRKIQ